MDNIVKTLADSINDTLLMAYGKIDKIKEICSKKTNEAECEQKMQNQYRTLMKNLDGQLIGIIQNSQECLKDHPYEDCYSRAMSRLKEIESSFREDI